MRHEEVNQKGGGLVGAISCKQSVSVRIYRRIDKWKEPRYLACPKLGDGDQLQSQKKIYGLKIGGGEPQA